MTNYVFGGGIERVVTYQFDNSLTHSKAPRSSAVSTESEQGSRRSGVPFYVEESQFYSLFRARDETFTIFPYSNKKLKLSHSPYYVILT